MKKTDQSKKTAAKAAPVKAAPAKVTDPNQLFVTDLDAYLWGSGVHYEIFRKLGAHPCEKDGKEGVYFAVWAPHAAAVHVIGSFNGWNE